MARFAQGKVVSDYYAKIGLAGAFGEISPKDPESARRVWDDAAQAVIGDFVMWCPVRTGLLSRSVCQRHLRSEPFCPYRMGGDVQMMM